MRTREGVGRRRRRLRLATAVVLVVAVGAAIAAGLSAASTTATSVTNYVAYVGGKPGKANLKLSPIYVGYVNQEGGPIVVGKTADNGVDAATAFVNGYAGGIGKHPLVLVKCYISSSEEEGQKCGQKFANNKKIVAVVMGAIVIGNDSLFSAIGGGKPVISGVSPNPVDAVQKNAAILYGDARFILAPYATFARDTLHVKSAALIYPQGAGLDAAAAGQTTAFQAAGIPIKQVSYPANTTDLTAPLVAAGAQTADLVMPVINPNDCGKFEKAVQALNIPDGKVLASPICLTPTTIQELGDFPQWIYAIASSLTTDTSDPAVPPYQKILKAVGQGKLIGDPWTNVGFGEIATLAKFLNALGPTKLSSKGILAQMKAFKGPMVLGSPHIQCGKYKDAPAICNDYTQFYKYDGKFVFKKVGDWVPPPKGWVPPKG
jgi:branched-chain amino acid transport system substrate-binding protein